MEQQRIYSGRVINLNLESAVLPNGVTTTLEIAHHPGGAAILAVDSQQRVCLIRQYRHAVGGWLWELPAGKIDHREPPIETARRELQEEAGLTAQDWMLFGSMVSSPGFCDEVIHLFLAQSLRSVPSSLDAHEVLEVHWRTRPELEAMIKSGELRDAKTLIAIFRWFLDASVNGGS